MSKPADTEIQLAIGGTTCASCAHRVERRLSQRIRLGRRTLGTTCSPTTSRPYPMIDGLTR